MPIITVSRMYGSGGSDVAARVAAALGWSLLDNALVERVAQRMRTTPAIVQAIEERVPSLTQRLAEALALGSPEYLPTPAAGGLAPTDERLLEVTRRVMEDAVAQGPVVVVGRGAQEMLAQRGDAVHVFCYAPRPALIARVMERHKVDATEAERIVDETNRQREQYVKRNWNRSWRAVENYHLCVNTEWLGLGGAANAIVGAARERFGAQAGGA
jgi:cytidylate kinase